MDARQRKTAGKLAEVILRLAAERPASEVTVSEVTIAAAINRSTFYQHASSPTDLLEKVLRAELDDIRTRYIKTTLAPTDPAMLREVTIAVLEHVAGHSEIYRRGLGVGSAAASLHSLLSQHFEESLLLLVEQHNIALPDDLDVAPQDSANSVSSAFIAASAARFVADGTVGAIDVWLRTPAPHDGEPHDVEQFLVAYRRYMPSWWPRESF